MCIPGFTVRVWEEEEAFTIESHVEVVCGKSEMCGFCVIACSRAGF